MQKPYVDVGADGRCLCGVDDVCPLGTTGSSNRCTKDEILANGFGTSEPTKKTTKVLKIPPNCRGARVVQLIEVSALEGKGVAADIFREVRYYYDFAGVLVATADPVKKE